LNGPSAPGTTGKDVVGYHTLTRGGKIQNKILPIQVENDLISGLQLMFTIDDENVINVNLGLASGPRS
jgi:hypothetical protein